MTARAKRGRFENLVVFLGPSLAEDEARAIAPCRVLPPARQGDVWRSLALRPRAIALIDGVFEAVPSVWHHEILAAMDAGVTVFGAASMGALRAAELWRHGMVGVGQIFGWYRDGILNDDSEVALLHAGPEHGYRAFTLPLVNVRHNAQRARSAGVLTAREALRLVEAAQSVFYQERTWERVLESVGTGWRRTSLGRWQQWAARSLEDPKALDARACIAAASEWAGAATRSAVIDIAAGPSSLVRRRRLADGASATPREGVIPNRSVLQALAARKDAPEMIESGLRTLLLAGWGREHGIEATREERKACEEAWWRELGIPPSRRDAFLAQNGLDRAEAERLWATMAIEVKLLENANRLLSDGPSPDEALGFEARRRGLWADQVARGCRKESKPGKPSRRRRAVRRG